MVSMGRFSWLRVRSLSMEGTIIPSKSRLGGTTLGWRRYWRSCLDSFRVFVEEPPSRIQPRDIYYGDCSLRVPKSLKDGGAAAEVRLVVAHPSRVKGNGGALEERRERKRSRSVPTDNDVDSPAQRTRRPKLHVRKPEVSPNSLQNSLVRSSSSFTGEISQYLLA